MEFPTVLTSLSVISRRVLQTLAIALWCINASRIMQFHRRAYYGAQQVRNSNEAEALAVDPSSWYLVLLLSTTFYYRYHIVSVTRAGFDQLES